MIHNTTPVRPGRIVPFLSRWAAMASSLMVLGGVFGGCAAVQQAVNTPDPQTVEKTASEAATEQPQLIHTDAKAEESHREWHQNDGKAVTPPGNHTLAGEASWYGKQFHGRLTANGETYDMYSQTAAHKTLPLGSVVRVSRPDTRQSVVVRVNDRGPYAKDRVIDLSYGAASDLDMVDSGTAKVEVEVLEVGDGKYKR